MSQKAKRLPSHPHLELLTLQGYPIQETQTEFRVFEDITTPGANKSAGLFFNKHF